MRYGGVTILPQEPFRSHDEYLLPARPMTLWHYTDLSDPRGSFGKRFIRLRTDDTMEIPQKIGRQPLERLQPGQSAEHAEIWSLHPNVAIGNNESSLEQALAPFIGQPLPQS